MNPWGQGPALLFCPGDRPDRFEKARERADIVILDLEDAVSPAQKHVARELVAASAGSSADRTIVRINPSGTPWFQDDVTSMRQAGVHTLMLPKASSREQLQELQDFQIVALCETAAGILAAPELALEPNCSALMWGGEDLVADLGGRSSRGANGRYRPMIEQARATVLFAAAAAGKIAIDAVHINVADLDGLAEESREAVDVGFDAKACIHPTHVEHIRNAFRPTEEQLDWARSILEHPEAERGGVFTVGNQMIDGPLLNHARTIAGRTFPWISN